MPCFNLRDAVVQPSLDHAILGFRVDAAPDYGDLYLQVVWLVPVALLGDPDDPLDRLVSGPDGHPVLKTVAGIKCVEVWSDHPKWQVTVPHKAPWWATDRFLERAGKARLRLEQQAAIHAQSCLEVVLCSQSCGWVPPTVDRVESAS